MKKITAKITLAILLITSVVFANFSISTHPASADERLPAIAYPTTPEDDLPEITGGESDEENSEDNNPSTPSNPAAPTDTETTEDADKAENTDPEQTEETSSTCQQESGSLAWIVCPTVDIITNAVDSIYKAIEQLLIVEPLSMASDSPIYLVWQYMRSLTNIVFIIFLVIVIYSQLTGLGISNYGVKRVLPRLIIAVILVNLSFIICSVAVDLSNIIGYSLRDFLRGIQETVIEAGASTLSAEAPIADIIATLIGGGTIAGVVISVSGGIGWLFWLLVPILLGGVISVVTGLITVATRQAIIALLIMIAPLAFVAYLLPNTEKWFTKWKDLLFRMLIFYPMFSFLFGASQLTGWALISSASNPLGIILGIGVQILPLFLGFSLMKMSGTILNTLNTGLRNLASPLQRAATGWSIEHAEHRRQVRTAYNESSTGANLRRYLDGRRELRINDTRNAVETRRNRALKYTFDKSSSSTGRDEYGNSTWSSRPNRYTRNAKTASYYSTIAGTASSAYQNTLSGYGRHFSDSASQRISAQHGEAFLDAMAQQFLTTNEAEDDQKYLLGRYMDAATSKNLNPYEYNRLIKSSAGGLGHLGESSIMGQVIVNSSTIENRRRTEARIIANKFGIKKPLMRGMAFDKAYINDNGIETDENGIEIEDDQYRLIPGKEHKHKAWQQYIGVHKETGKEITKEEYDKLSESEVKSYRRVCYFDITDDQGKPIQRVFEDDAGYMKELLRDDIAIGDPINIRYLSSIGVAHTDSEKTGLLRRYHSTIATAMLESKYKEHSGEVTPMLTSQANSGYITSKAQYNIGNLQSLSVATKPSAFLINDSFAIKNWANLIASVSNEEEFKKYFPDNAINDYRDVNGQELGGMRPVYDSEDNQIGWEELDKTKIPTLEEKKNLLKHKIIPRAATKLAGMLYRDFSPSVIENQKPDTLQALRALSDTLKKAGLDNLGIDEKGNINPDAPDITKRLNPSVNIFGTPDPKVIKKFLTPVHAAIDNYLRSLEDDTPPSGDNNGDNNNPPTSPSGNGNNNPPTSGGNNGGSNPNQPPRNPYQSPGINQVLSSLERKKEAQERFAKRNDPNTIKENVDGYFASGITDINELGDQLKDYFDQTEVIHEYAQEYEDIINRYRFDDKPQSTQEAINQVTNFHQREEDRMEQLQTEIDQFLSRIDYDY